MAFKETRCLNRAVIQSELDKTHEQQKASLLVQEAVRTKRVMNRLRYLEQVKSSLSEREKEVTQYELQKSIEDKERQLTMHRKRESLEHRQKVQLIQAKTYHKLLEEQKAQQFSEQERDIMLSVPFHSPKTVSDDKHVMKKARKQLEKRKREEEQRHQAFLQTLDSGYHARLDICNSKQIRNRRLEFLRREEVIREKRKELEEYQQSLKKIDENFKEDVGLQRRRDQLRAEQVQAKLSDMELQHNQVVKDMKKAKMVKKEIERMSEKKKSENHEEGERRRQMEELRMQRQKEDHKQRSEAAMLKSQTMKAEREAHEEKIYDEAHKKQLHTAVKRNLAEQAKGLQQLYEVLTRRYTGKKNALFRKSKEKMNKVKENDTCSPTRFSNSEQEDEELRELRKQQREEGVLRRKKKLEGVKLTNISEAAKLKAEAAELKEAARQEDELREMRVRELAEKIKRRKAKTCTPRSRTLLNMTDSSRSHPAHIQLAKHDRLMKQQMAVQVMKGSLEEGRKAASMRHHEIIRKQAENTTQLDLQRATRDMEMQDTRKAKQKEWEEKSAIRQKEAVNRELFRKKTKEKAEAQERALTQALHTRSISTSSQEDRPRAWSREPYCKMPWWSTKTNNNRSPFLIPLEDSSDDSCASEEAKPVDVGCKLLRNVEHDLRQMDKRTKRLLAT